MDFTIHDSPLADMEPSVLYDVLRLRVDVFVVEQECPYPELDGRDLEPTARMAWATDRDGRVVATLRVLREPDGDVRIGRVATATDARGRGVAARLMEHALTLAGGAPTMLDAQSHLHDWYARFGFTVAGEEFVEDGIPHLPMRRPAGTAIAE